MIMMVIYNQNGTIDLMATREARLGNPTEEELEDDLVSIADENWTNYWERVQEQAKEDLDPIVELVETHEARQEFFSDPCWQKSF
jgi:hypothetical protein